MHRLDGLRPVMAAATYLLAIHLHGVSSTPIQETDRYLQACPPGLTSDICALDNLKNPDGYSACVNECLDATCCQPQDGEPSCMFSCGSKCFSYMDCMNLNDIEAPVDDEEELSTAYPTYSPTSNDNDDSSIDSTNIPTSTVTKKTADDHIDEDVKLSCPPGLLPGICALDKIQNPEGFDACAKSCLAATCCQPEDGEPSCMADCGGKCMEYIDCMNLSKVDAPLIFSIDDNNIEGPSLPDTSPPASGGTDTKLSKSDTLSVDYYEGFNLNFVIDESDANTLMFSHDFIPLKLDGTHVFDSINLDTKRNLRGEWEEHTESSSNGYYYSLYAAKLGVDINGEHHRVGRADLFTYALDPHGKLSLLLVGCYMEIPKMLKDLGEAGIEHYHQLITDLAPDSRTGGEAYPHFLVETFDFDDGLIIGGGDLGVDESIIINVKECEGSSALFTKQWINANSIAWRSPIDKNTNYFNQDFINAPVKAYNGEKCTSLQQLGHLQSTQLPPSAKLENIEFYGSREEPIVWKYDDSVESVGTPFLTYDQKQEAIELKRQIYSDMWQARAAMIKEGETETLIDLVQGKNSVFIIWELSTQAVADLSTRYNLDNQGLRIVPIKVAKDDLPKYIIALNVYHSEISGDLNGAAVRYEYSTFIANGQDDNIPYYMVIQAGSSTDTLDPVHGKESATKASLIRDGNMISLVANTLSATLNLGDEEVITAKDFITANGKVYWTNGVYDAVYFDTSLIQARPKTATFSTYQGDFEWTEILGDQDPVHTFVYEDENIYVVSPWYNMKETNSHYREIKLPTFGSMADYESSLIRSGQKEPSIDVIVYGNHPTLPRVNINFEITNVMEFTTRFLKMPKGYGLAPMRFTEKSTTSMYTLTLSLFHESFSFDYAQAPPWDKLVYTTYIQEESTGKTYLYEFHVVLSEVGLDVVEGLKPPADVFNISSVADDVIINVQDGDISLDMSIPRVGDVADDSKIGLSDSWINTHERVYWKKGVYDKLYINDQLSEAKVNSINVEKLSIIQNVPWAEYVEEKPYESYYFLDDVTFISMPWANIEEIV